jgi:hypothetical protein
MTAQQTQTLAKFLLARLAEDEAAQSAADGWHPTAWHRADCDSNSYSVGRCDCDIPARVLAECEAKRRIVELHSGDSDDMCQSYAGNYVYEPCPTLRALASVHADHPDYREEWRP